MRDLPPTAAERFRTLRTTLLELEGVTERIKFIRPNWKWTWEYALPNRKLCWLHMMETGIGGTFTLSLDDEREIAGVKLASVIAEAIRSGQRTGPVLWSWVEFSDRKSIDAFLAFMKRKATWVAATPQDSRIFRRSKAG